MVNGEHDECFLYFRFKCVNECVCLRAFSNFFIIFYYELVITGPVVILVNIIIIIVVVPQGMTAIFHLKDNT